MTGPRFPSISFRLKSIAPALMLSLFPFVGAQADLLEYSFTAASGEQRTLAPGARFANPVGSIDLALNAGVDRKIRASIVPASSDAAISSATSHLIGAGDRIVVGGTEHYGARLQLPAPGEGEYRIKAEILSSDGQSVAQVDYYPLTVDTTPPAAGAWSLSNKTFGTPYGWDTTGAVWHAGCESVSGTNSNIIQRTGMTDPSGLAKAYARAYVKSSGGLAGEMALQISPTAGMINAESMCGLFPSGYQREYVVKWHVADRAGNERVITQEMFWDSEKSLPVPYAVQQAGGTNDSGIANFQSYTPGMTVQANPLKVLFKIPESNWHETAVGGMLVHGYTPTLIKQSGGYRYYQFECMIGKYDSCGRLADKTSWGFGYTGSLVNVTLGDQATVAPTLVNVEYNYSDIGWGGQGRRVPTANLPVSVNGIRVTVQPRPYTQRVIHTSGSCYVGPNQSSCVVPWTFTMTRGTWGYIHGCCVQQGVPAGYSGPAIPADTQGPVRVVKDDDTRFATAYSYPAISWNDVARPAMTKAVKTLPNTIDATVTYAPQGGLQGQLGMSSVAARAGGQMFSGATLSVSGDGVERSVRFGLSKLADGQHPVQVVMTDLHGNTVAADAGTVTIDNTAPVVTVRSEPTITSLDEISIALSDALDAAPAMKSITLTGGPANENVALAWSKVSGNTYRLEYPILFPSMVEGEEYRVTVSASDAHGNVGSSSHVFIYSPAVQSSHGRLPAAPFLFTGRDGIPVINSEPLVMSTGEVVSGTYEVYATLRSDAVSAFYIGGKLVSPGATVTLDPLDFSATGGRVRLPARPAKAGAAGVSGVLITTSAPNAPSLVVDVTSWMPKITTARSVDDPIQAVSRQVITPQVDPSSVCPVTTDEAKARASDPLRGPVCFLEWTSIPDGLKVSPYTAGEFPLTRLEGVYQVAGQQAATYTVSLFDTDSNRRVIMQGSEVVEVQPPLNTATFRQSMEGQVMRRAIDERKVIFSQTSSPKCVITGNEEQARAAARDEGPLTCLLEFTSYPEGMTLTNPDTPELTGTIQTVGTHPLTWTASVFDASGKKLELQQGESVIEVVHPDVTTALALVVDEGSEATGTPVETLPQAWTEKSYSVLSLPQQGRVEVLSEGFRYIASPSYVGPDEFRYRVTDASGMYAEGVATVQVHEFNYAPTVQPMDVSASRMVTTVVPLQVQDPNSWDSHVFEIVDAPAPAGVRATIVRRELHLEPVNYWHGDLTLSYRAVDKAGVGSEPALIRVSIPLGDQPPVVTNKSMSFKDNVTESLMLTSWDADSPPAQVFEIVSPPENVTASIVGRKLTVKSINRWKGTTSLTFRAQDDSGLWSEPATVNIEVTESLESQVESGSAGMIIKFKIKGL